MSTPQVNTSNKSNLLGGLRVAMGEITRAAASAPMSVRNDLIGAMSDCVFNLEQVTQSQAEASRILADMRYSGQEKLRQAQALMSKSFQASAAANNALVVSATKARKQLEQSLLPKPPKDVSEALMLDRKQDLTALLNATNGTPSDKIAAVAKALRRALQTGDDLTSYVLQTQMAWVYAANGMASEAVLQAFAGILGEPPTEDDNDPSDDRAPLPGALLLASLQRGGPNTVAGMLAVAGVLLYQAQQAWQSWITMTVNNGQVQGVAPDTDTYRAWKAHADAEMATINQQAKQYSAYNPG